MICESNQQQNASEIKFLRFPRHFVMSVGLAGPPGSGADVQGWGGLH